MFAEKANYPIKMMARVLKVSRSGYYAWQRRMPNIDLFAGLKAEIERRWLDSKKVFGARSIHSRLHHDPESEFAPTLYRVQKCMRELGIQGIQTRASKKTTVADPKASIRPDLIKRDFTSPAPTIKLVGDITYLKTGEGWLYLATVIDLCTRMVVGWSLADNMKSELVIDALAMAHTRGYVAENGIFHSDLGSQYTSKAFSQFTNSIGVRLSVGRKGTCFDNAVAESFFSTLKNQMYHHHSFATRSKAKNAVVGFIEGFYNRERPHSSIDYQIPAEKMDSFFKRTEYLCCEDLVKCLAA
jgi:putative transposase